MSPKYLIVAFSLLPFLLNAQNDTLKVIHWQARAMYGMNIPLNAVEVGEPSDELIEYSDNSDYIHLGATLFLDRERTWGLDGIIQLQSHKVGEKSYADFRRSVNEKYESDYYILQNTIGQGEDEEDESSPGNFGNVNKFYIGASYHHREGKFRFTPRFMVGLVQVESKNAEINLKRKNSNEITEVTYFSSKPDRPHFSVLMGPTVGYQLVKNLMIYAEFYYSYMHANFNYTIKERNVYTESTTETSTDHPNNVHAFNAGIGLILDLSY
jgi:hypothetical protein